LISEIADWRAAMSSELIFCVETPSTSATPRGGCKSFARIDSSIGPTIGSRPTIDIRASAIEAKRVCKNIVVVSEYNYLRSDLVARAADWPSTGVGWG
jgi:hypothetical protein